MVSKEITSEETHWFENESSDDWMSTSHEDVYFRDGTPKVLPSINTRDLVIASAGVGKALPGDWTVVVTAGPHRGHDVEYVVDPENNRLHLDFYSVRPGYHHIPDLIEDVKQDISDATEAEEGGEQA